MYSFVTLCSDIEKNMQEITVNKGSKAIYLMKLTWHIICHGTTIMIEEFALDLFIDHGFVDQLHPLVDGGKAVGDFNPLDTKVKLILNFYSQIDYSSDK